MPISDTPWFDHLQNAIDQLVPSLTTAQSRALAENWDAIFMAAESEQDACRCDSDHCD